MRAGCFNEEIITVQMGPQSTATANVIVGPVDISRYERYCLFFQNNATAVGMNDLKVQLAIDASANGDNGSAAPNWVTAPTASIPFPSSMLASSVAMTSAIENGAHWLRIKGALSATAAGTFRLMIGGYSRKG